MSRQRYVIGYRIVYALTLALLLTCTRYLPDNPYDADYRGNYAFHVDFSGFPADGLRANAVYTLPYAAYIYAKLPGIADGFLAGGCKRRS